MHELKLSTATINFLSEAIRAQFDQIDFVNDYIFNEAERCIKAANELGLEDLANEMISDAKEY